MRIHPQRHPRTRAAAALFLLPAALTFAATPLAAQSTAAQPWFGLDLPPGLGDPHRSPVAFPPDFAPAPAVVPQGEEENTALTGDLIYRDLETIVGFSVTSRAEGERMWGRITGRPTAANAADWVAGRFREIGLRQVEIQTFSGTVELWWPAAWEVRLVGDPAFGPGSGDVVLESALPTSGSELAGPITAPLVFVGPAGEPAPDIDVRGRIAVQLLRPQGGAYAERGRTVAAARELMERGAVAVLNAIEQPGNMHVRDFSNCGGVCFNLGGDDTAFLLAALERARDAGLTEPRARVSLRTERLADLTGYNVVGVVPGTGDEVIIVNAHVDGWFDAAGDNADGLAVQLALARYFTEPDNEPLRTLVFVATAGHHTPGMNGPSNFVRMNPEIAARTVLVLNLEHVAQLALDPSDWSFRPTEQRMSFGISNQSPYLMDVARRGARRYGFNIAEPFPASVPGELGGYASLEAARVQAIHAGPLYHTSGDVLETISLPGLERAARFFAYYIREVARAPRAWIDP